MNPASRLHNFIVKLQAYEGKNIQLQEAYFEVFEVNNVFDMYSALHVLQQQVSTVRSIFIKSNKLEKYSDLLTLITKLVAPDSIVQSIASVANVIKHVEPKLMVLADAFEITDFEEEDISEELDAIMVDLDEFLGKIKTLDIDTNTKILYANITYKLKLSIEHYALGGKASLEEKLRVFTCITSGEEASNSIIEKLSFAVEKAQQTKEIAGFFIDNVVDVVGFLGR